jgi:hypothetical protein
MNESHASDEPFNEPRLYLGERIGGLDLIGEKPDRMLAHTLWSLLQLALEPECFSLATFVSHCFGQLAINWEIDIHSPLEPSLAALMNGAKLLEELGEDLPLQFETSDTPYQDGRFGVRQLLIRRVRFTTDGKPFSDNYQHECDQQVLKLCREVITQGAWMGRT